MQAKYQALREEGARRLAAAVAETLEPDGQLGARGSSARGRSRLVRLRRPPLAPE
jgi:hypothetical protein